MKYQFQGKFIVATSESAKDNMLLMGLVHEEKKTETVIVPLNRRVIRRNKKLCDICMGTFRGLNLHKSKAHGISNKKARTPMLPEELTNVLKNFSVGQRIAVNEVVGTYPEFARRVGRWSGGARRKHETRGFYKVSKENGEVYVTRLA